MALVVATLLQGAYCTVPGAAFARSLQLEDGSEIAPQTDPDTAPEIEDAEPEALEDSPPTPQITTIPLPPAGASPTVRTLPPETPITVSNQEAPSLDDFGLLDPGKGGFSGPVWEGATRAEIAQLLPLIPEGLASPSLRASLTKLLLTRTKAPHGKPDDKNAPDLLALRLKALIKLGAEDQAAAMLKVLPASFANERALGLSFELALLRGDITGVCGEARKHLDKFDTLDWQKRVIFCHAAQKQNDEAQLGLDLLSEQNRDSGGFFAALIQRMLHPKSKAVLALANEMSTEEYAMLVASGVPLPQDFAAKAPLSALRAAAKRKDLPAPARAEILERGVMFGMSPPAPLVEAYQALGTKEKKAKGVAARAALYQSALAAKDAKRLPLLSQALALYAQDELEPLAFMLYLPLAKESINGLRDGNALPANLDLFALLLAGGEDALAERYLNLLPLKTHAFQKSVGKLMLDFYRYRGSPLTAASLAAPENAPAADIKRQFRLYRLIAALGIPMNAEKRLALSTGRVKYDVEMPSPDLLDAFGQARAAKAKGKIVLLSSLLIGDADMAHASDMVLEQIVQALREAGMEKEARALALEAMVTAGY